jgi:hypothetical protein
MSNPIIVEMRCLYVGCVKRGPLRLRYDDRGNPNTTPFESWMTYAVGHPTTENLGICPDHQAVTLSGTPPLDVKVTTPNGGAPVFHASSQGTAVGTFSFTTNTRKLDLPTGSPASLQAAGEGVARAYGFDV